MPSDITDAAPRPAPADAVAPGARHAGLVLTVIATAQLMVVLDGTIMNIALPSIQGALHVSAVNLAWVVNAYALAFGGLLLLGGRAGDLFGRRRMFRAGIILFTAASLLGGLAPNSALLISARVVQGIGASIVAPTALSLIAVNFAEGKPRNRAMGAYAAMAGLGSTIGLLLGGVLTEYLDWRWVLFVNIPIGLAVLAGSKLLAEGERGDGRLDVPGAVTGTGGLVALVYAITRGGQNGWGNGLTVTFFAVAVVLLALFLARQARTEHPMLPLRLFRDRNRSGSYATMLFLGSGMFATFYFLTLYMQLVLGYSPVRTGLAYLPFSFGMGIAAGVSSKLVAQVAPRWIAGPGLALGAAGMLWLSTLTPHSSYPTRLMPAMFITALGLGLSFVPMTLGAVKAVRDQDAGIASALLNTGQQVGGALGLAILTTIATTAANTRLPAASASFYRAAATHDYGLLTEAAKALTHGYTTAFAVAAALFVTGLLITVFAINAKKQAPDGQAPAAHLG